MTTELAELVADLAAGRDALLDALSGCTEAEARYSPGPDRWSALDCAEHVVLVENYLYGQLLAATDATGPAANPQREQLIRARAATRTRRVPAPELAIPSGRYPTLEAALRAFLDSRARTICFVEQCAVDLRARVTTHPILGPVNCFETLLMMAAHPRRHADQIREIRAALTGPTPAHSPQQS